MPFDHSEAVRAPVSSSFSVKEIAAHCNQYKGAETGRSVFQLVSTLFLFVALCAVMFFCLEISYWLTALLTVPAAGLLTRIFIFQHDCGHGSFFKSKKANDWTGRFLSLLTVTPYDFWRRAHNMHHATSGDLERRSIGAIDTITVKEYQALTARQKFLYKLYRNPILLLVLGTPLYVIVAQRIPFKQSTHFHEGYQTLEPSSIRKSIMLTNLSLVLFYGILGAVFGFGPLMAVYLPTLIATAWLGGWLFFIQHQFEDTYWAGQGKWDRQEAALGGSSYYALHPVLQWFTGNIGLHHIHHLCSSIPNYKLQQCMDDFPELKTINRLSLKESLQCIHCKLWDEEQERLVRIPHGL